MSQPASVILTGCQIKRAARAYIACHILFASDKESRRGWRARTGEVDHADRTVQPVGCRRSDGSNHLLPVRMYRPVRGSAGEDVSAVSFPAESAVSELGDFNRRVGGFNLA